jgi:hypothetical protein
MILPHHANPRGCDFRERQEELVSPYYNITFAGDSVEKFRRFLCLPYLDWRRRLWAPTSRSS